MSRRRAVVILIVVVGGLIGASMSTILAGTQDMPARFAQVSVGTHTLDIWRVATTHDITFHWDEQSPGEEWRFVPAGSLLQQLSNGRVVHTTRYPTGAAAWHAITSHFGVTWQSARAALLQGSPSPLPPTSA